MTLLAPRSATSTVFLIHGIMVGTWVAQIPWVQANLKITNTELGLALLFIAVGAVVAMTVAGQALTRISSRRMVRSAALVCIVVFPLALVSPSWLTLALSLFAFGATNGAMDVSMNAHGIGVERALGKPIMSSLHGFWSLGTLVGATLVAISIAGGMDPRVEVIVLAAALWLLAFFVTGRIGSVERPADAAPTRISLPSRAVLPLGILAIALAFLEGGVSDWGGIYLGRTLGAEPGLAAAAFAAFALGMTVGRLSGDIVNQRIGAGRLLRGGAALAGLTIGGLLLVGVPAVALFGLVLAGVGVANGLPLLFSAAGRIPPSAPSLSAVFTMGYGGFLFGPPIMGFVADHVGLPGALSLLVVMAAAVAVFAGRAPGVEGVSAHEPLRDPVGMTIP